jgi:uncharacterized protein (AIM24 family)
VTDNLNTAKHGDRTLVPNFINQTNESFLALNVNNDIITYRQDDKGSKFVKGLRSVHPFEAYMLSASGARSISVGDDMTTGIKGAGDLFGKALRGKATGESAVKPEYSGHGALALEPTYRYIILVDVSTWGNAGLVIEDGMFLACDGSVKQSIQRRSNVSSAVAGGEGLFNLRMSGRGVVALESRVPRDELIVIDLTDDVLRIDGPMAVAWSGSLDFRVERATSSLIGSAASGEGLVNVYRGTGRVLMSPVASSLVVS